MSSNWLFFLLFILIGLMLTINNIFDRLNWNTHVNCLFDLTSVWCLVDWMQLNTTSFYLDRSMSTWWNFVLDWSCVNHIVDVVVDRSTFTSFWIFVFDISSQPQLLTSHLKNPMLTTYGNFEFDEFNVNHIG